jgi:hypothetical protein
MNDLTFDDKVDQLHQQLAARERDAMQAEQRLQRLNLPVGSVKGRSYGELPTVTGLTATAMVAKADPALAMLLGLPVPRPNYEQQAAAEARQQQIERMQRETDATRQRNQQAAHNRYQANLSGVNVNTGRRWT